MRTVLGALLLTMSEYATLGAVFLMGWSANDLAAVTGLAAIVLVVTSVTLLWRGPPRRWLVVVSATGFGFAFLILAMATLTCGMSAHGQDMQGNTSQELFIRAFGYELHKELGAEGAMLAKMLRWGVLLTGLYVAVGAGFGSLAGECLRRQTTTQKSK